VKNQSEANRAASFARNIFLKSLAFARIQSLALRAFKIALRAIIIKRALRAQEKLIKATCIFMSRSARN
jgi:hypothetical protein